MEQLQKHIKQLEEEKHATCQEAAVLKEKVEELKNQLTNKSPENDMVCLFLLTLSQTI